MIELDVPQRSDEWVRARLGLPTASCFGKILSPEGKPSRSSTGYLHRLLAERITGSPVDAYESPAMTRGVELESEAVSWYGFNSGLPTRSTGLVYLDALRRVACSPDALVGDDGGLEVKCPLAPGMVEWAIDGMPSDHIPQVQGCLWITGRAWWDALAYHPDFDPVVVRVERDEKYIEKLADAVGMFVAELEAQAKRLQRRSR